ncbi:MAG TPA: alpha/beta hydrolase-fold protein, partial [Kiritimatiellia bacterium]|nr:alpha/beta hydrolase-fold protein [Kiritimatiellia bacterium]
MKTQKLEVVEVSKLVKTPGDSIMKRRTVLSAFLLLAAVSTALGFAPRTYDVTSPSMGKAVPVTIVLPKGYEDDPARRHPVVYLLHGANDTDFHAYHPLFRKAADENGVILVAPCGTLSWWMDSPVDPKHRYETFVTKELIPWVDARYRTIPDRMHRGLAGNSMGGHGALYLAIRNKGLFSAAGSIFGGLDLWACRDKDRWELRERLGDPKLHPEHWKDNSVVNLAKGLKDGELATFTAVGWDDIFIESNRDFHETLVRNGVKHLYLEKDGGHSQEFWEEMYPKMIRFLGNWFRTAQLGWPAAPPPKPATILYGDGEHDDTAAIQAKLDTGASCVYLPPPAKEYLISDTLLLGDGQELRLDRFTRIRLAPHSDCPMVANRDVKKGNRHLALSGGIWDFDNLRQGINFMHRKSDDPPQRAYPSNVSYSPWLYRGNVFYF